MGGGWKPGSGHPTTSACQEANRRQTAITEGSARTILFVCTGNTCRSPMAEAIGRHLLGPRGEGGVRTDLFSAGTGTLTGLPATPEAIRAVTQMGIEAQPHRSTTLTAEMVRGATVVYAMAQSHLEQICALAPDARQRVFLLDPDGRDIADPLGYPQHVYDETACAIRAALERRLQPENEENGR